MILDIGLGILSSVFTSWIFDVELSTKIIVLGMLFALLPDIDVLWGIFMQNTKWWKRGIWGHREFTHYPIVHLIIALVVYVIAGAVWAFLYLLGTIAHLVHDSIDGWGIKWLWPLNNSAYRIFYRGEIMSQANWDDVGHGHTGNWKMWIKDIYLRKYLPFEVGFFLLSILGLYLYAK